MFFLIVLFEEGRKTEWVIVNYEFDIKIIEVREKNGSTVLLRAFTGLISEQLPLFYIVLQ